MAQVLTKPSKRFEDLTDDRGNSTMGEGIRGGGGVELRLSIKHRLRLAFSHGIFLNSGIFL